MEAIIGILVGLVLGAAIAWLAMKLKTGSEVAVAEQRLMNADQENSRLREESHKWQEEASGGGRQVASLYAQLDAANKRLAEQTDIENTLTDRFKVLATEVIDSNNEKFLAAAGEKVGTLSQELKRIETARSESQGSLKQQIEALSNSNKALEQETRNLTTALKRPEVRGSWGEIQLRRVVELAGMTNYCDYEEQISIQADDGSRDRPDMVVRMPSNRTIVIDAKTPMNAYLESIESDTEPDREAKLVRHTDQVKSRVSDLSRKSYWDALDRSPEFVVMFLPGEFLLQPALERDPTLFDRAMQQKIIITTPNTLMALLKTVEMGWKEAKIAEHALEVQKIGQELHDRLATYAGHIVKVGSSLSSAVNNYNSAVGSFDGRVAVSARRFKDLGVQSSDDIPEVNTIDIQVRPLSSAIRDEPEGALRDGHNETSSDDLLQDS